MGSTALGKQPLALTIEVGAPDAKRRRVCRAIRTGSSHRDVPKLAKFPSLSSLSIGRQSKAYRKARAPESRTKPESQNEPGKSWFNPFISWDGKLDNKR